MSDSKISENFLQFLNGEGYSHVKVMSDGNVCAIFDFIFTTAIISDIDQNGYGDRWCYHDKSVAIAALEAWNGTGEPPHQDVQTPGWHRHPNTGRRYDPSGNLTINH